MLRLVKLLGRVQQRLGRDASDIEAGAAERGAALDTRHFHAELGGADGADIAAGPGADDDQVETIAHARGLSGCCAEPTRQTQGRGAAHALAVEWQTAPTLWPSGSNT